MYFIVYFLTTNPRYIVHTHIIVYTSIHTHFFSMKHIYIHACTLTPYLYPHKEWTYEFRYLSTGMLPNTKK